MQLTKWALTWPTGVWYWVSIDYFEEFRRINYIDVIMGTMASQITSLTIVWSTVYSGADQIRYQNPASLASVRVIHRWSVISPHKGPVKRKKVSIWWRHYVILTFHSVRRSHLTRGFATPKAIHTNFHVILSWIGWLLYHDCLGIIWQSASSDARHQKKPYKIIFP